MTERTAVTLAQRSVHHDYTRRVRRSLREPKVPVVKVNPFMSEREHTWSKEKSLPEFYEKPDVMHSSTELFIKPPPTAFSTSSDSMLTTRENRPILPLSDLNKPNLEAANVASVPPKTSTSKIKLFDEEPHLESVRGRRVVFPPTPRDTCISPENPIKRLPKRGFAPTIVDREKKTVVESPVTKPTSLLNRERTQEFVSKQQVLKLRGLRMMDGGHLAPAPSTYLRTGANRSLEEFYRQLVNSYNRGYAFSPTKTRHSHNPSQLIHDPHRYQADPLLSLNHESVSHRFSSSLDTVDSKSAFRILETAGKPTSIEQNLARDYMMYCDTSKQGSTAVPNNQHFTRFLKLKNYNPTQGELFIMVNKEQNRAGHWTPRGKMVDLSQSADRTRTESWYQSTDHRGTTAVSPENITRLSNHEELALPPAEEVGAGEVKDADRTGVEVAVAADEGVEQRKSPERLEIKTTLPDIDSNQQ